MSESRGVLVDNQFFKLTENEISDLCSTFFPREVSHANALLSNGTKKEDKEYINKFSARLNNGAEPERLLQNIRQSIERLRLHRPQQ